MQTISYVKGDATKPKGEGPKIIVHICNDIGGWGAGFVLALSNRWELPEKNYHDWFKSGKNFKLGEVQMVQVEPDIWVANLIGQRDVVPGEDGKPPIRYKAVYLGMEKLEKKAKKLKASVHMPRIGCGLAGGKWNKIEPIISENLTEQGIPVTVYDL
ncbi:hypothetical protein [Saccharicrinis sp. FJH54]|uniref:hypothetical protein n=1 Tax=Saccharicrinis sp. FJH54 TaxID=3344665 RepID=UPI0035D439C0